jgi:hypothetical protein
MVTGKSHKPTRFARFVLYPIAGIIFCIILAVLLTLANGYRFTYKEGHVSLTKTGMLILTTRPFDASISLNGKTTKYRTSFHLLATKIAALKPGNYKVEVKKSGYRTWTNTLDIQPNMVTWANYILLFANKLNIAEIEVPRGTVIAHSESGRQLLFMDRTTAFDLVSLDVNNLSQRKFWPISTPLETWLTLPIIQSAEFSPNTEIALLKITNGARTEYVVSDTRSGSAKLIHLNVTLGQDFDNAWWSVSNSGELYLQTAKGISLVNIGDSVISTPVLDSAVTLGVDRSKQVLCVAKDAAGDHSVERMNLDGGNKATLVGHIESAKSYKLGYSTQRDILTVLNNDTGELTAYYVGNKSKKTATLLSSGITYFDWSKNGDYLYYYGKDFVKRYDWEKEKETVVALTETPIKLGWYFDEHHYVLTNIKGTFVMDVDGSNIIPISETPVSFSTYEVSNNNIIYAKKDTLGVTKFYKFISEF